MGSDQLFCGGLTVVYSLEDTMLLQVVGLKIFGVFLRLLEGDFGKTEKTILCGKLIWGWSEVARVGTSRANSEQGLVELDSLLGVPTI